METKSVRLYRLAELAQLTGLPTSWLRREADAGRLPCLRAGRFRMFDISAVLKTLADRTGEGVARAK